MKFLVITAFLSVFAVGTFERESKEKLEPCPSSPNCVSTQALRKRKQMNPISYRVTTEAAQVLLKSILANYSTANLIRHSGPYYHYEFTTEIGSFVDDVEFLFNDKEKVIDFRSASRIGYGDFGKNRRRMKRIVKDWNRLSKR